MKAAISGINGRMGIFLYRILSKRENIDIVYGIDQKKNFITIPIHDDLDMDVDLLIDFTNASFANNIIAKALEKGIKVVSGTTGLKDADINRLRNLALEKNTSLILVPNFAFGASIMYYLTSLIADEFSSFDIIETHNINKLDKPSGTAKEYGKLLNLELKNIQSIRLNEVIASHEIYFNNNGERLTIKHEILSRDAFLKGFLQSLDRILNDEFILITGLKDFYRVFSG